MGEQGGTTWTFPAPGRYALTFAVEAHLLTGEPVTTEESYAVVVRGEPAEAPLPEPVPESAPESVPEPAPNSAQVPPAARALPGAALAAQAQSAPTTPGSVVLSEGHVDAMAPRVLDGKLQIQVKDGTTVGQFGGQVRWREPGNVVFQANRSPGTRCPPTPRWPSWVRRATRSSCCPSNNRPGSSGRAGRPRNCPPTRSAARSPGG